jgi:transposase, IS5 family
MGQSHLAHAAGGAINAVLAAAGYNFRRLQTRLRLLSAGFLDAVLATRSFKSPADRLLNRVLRGAH